MSVSSMTSVAAARRQVDEVDFAEQPPHSSHWTRVCLHDLVPRLKRYASGARARMQCRKCGSGVGANVPAAGVTELWDEGLEQRSESEYRKACEEWQARRLAVYQSARNARAQEWWATYSRYLKSAVWQRKRYLVMERNRRLHRGLCEACGENPPSDVHHTKYPDTFGHEPLWDLQAVCRRCHEIFHPHMKENSHDI